MATQIQSALVILRRKQVQARTGLSRSGIYQKMADGDFPKSISLGLRAVGWIESEIESWLNARVTASRNSTSLEQSAVDNAARGAALQRCSFAKKKVGV